MIVAAPGYVLERWSDGVYVLKGGETVNEFGYQSDAAAWTWSQHLKLTPCVDCDSVPHVTHDRPPIPSRKFDWAICCGDCKEGTEPVHGETPEEAAEKWNDSQTLQCHQCGEEHPAHEMTELSVAPVHDEFEHSVDMKHCEECHARALRRHAKLKAEDSWEEECDRRRKEWLEEGDRHD